MAHQILPVLELRSLLHQSFSILDRNIRVRVLVHDLSLGRHVIPVDVELGHSRFFSQDVASQAGDVWVLWRLLIHFRCVVLHVDIITNTQEFLAVLVGACEKHSGDANNVGLWES